MNSFVTNTYERRPINWCKTLPSALKELVVFLIVPLSFCIRPSTVIRTVWPISVYPINRVFFGRGSPHVIKKVGECFPSFTHVNSAPAISGVVQRTLLFAPSTHKSPRVVLFGCPSPIRVSALAVCSTCFRSAYFLQASTRLRMLTTQFFSFNRCSVSARTFTNPVSFFSLFFCPANYGKLVKDLTLHINKFGQVKLL